MLLSVTLVKDINTTVGASSYPDALVNLDGTLLFVDADGSGANGGKVLYRSDGTAAGTQRLSTTVVYGKPFRVGRQAFFFSGTDLWITDGTTAGTRLVKSIGVTSYQMVELGGALYFCDNSTATGPLRLWRSDGTAAGTVVVKTITERNASPKDHQLTRFGNSLYFTAWSGSLSSNYDIYKSDGTTAGTVVFKSVVSDFAAPSNFQVFGGSLYFNSGDYPAFTGTRTFRTDGTTTGLFVDGTGTPVSMGSVYGIVGDFLYFNGGGIWKTDGTPAGTSRVGTYYPSTLYQSQAVLGDALYLEGNVTGNGDVELVKTSGSDVTLFKDINALNSGSSSYPMSLTAFDGKLYFSANDGVHGSELWRSDGTSDGTVLDTDIFPGLSGSSPDNLIDINGTLFLAAADASHGRELFKVASSMAAPLGLRAAPAGDSLMSLTWGNPGPHATGFKVERSTDGVNFTQVALVTDPAASGYLDSGLSPSTTYYYRVRATTAAGDTPYSGRASAATAAPIPAPPSNVTAASVPGVSDSISLAWVDNSSNETGFRIYRSTDPSPSRTYSLVTTVAAGTQAYVDTGLAPGTTYYYVIASYSAAGEARNTTAASATTHLAQAPFSGLASSLPGTVQAEDFDLGGPTIAYSDLTGGNAGGQYRTGDDVDVYATADASGGYRVESAAGEWTEYTVNAVIPSGLFHVELRIATGGAGARVHLEADGVDVSGPVLIPDTGSPTEFRTLQINDVTLPVGKHVLRLVTDANPAGASGVQVNWMRFSSVGSGAAPSAAPSDLVAAALSRTQVDLTWADHSNNEASFAVERRLASSPNGWGVVGLADANDVSFADASIAPNTQYAYRVRAVNAAGTSAYSNEASVTTPDAPAVQVKDINHTSPDSNPRQLVSVNGLTFFVDDDGTSGLGYEQLWVSDGTAAGTIRLTIDLKPTRLTRVGNVIFFTNQGQPNTTLDAELWRSDGTVAGTFLVKDIFPGPVHSSVPDHLTDVNGVLYFSAVDASGVGRELWKSDGTATGTVLVADINPLGNSNPTNMIGVNGKLVFTAEDGTTGTSLWASDGTAAGTQLIADLWPGPDTLTIDQMTGAGGLAYFRSNTGELWRTDGTAAGSFKVSTTHPSQLLVVGNNAYFGVGTEFWKSDGTVAGTAMLADAASTGPTGFATDGTSVYYFATVTGETGYRLWRSDGTAASTGPVTGAGLAPWTFTAPPTGLVAAGAGKLFFSADDGTTGPELWTSDGTAAGTHLVKDIAPTGGSLPVSITAAGGGVVLFQAWDPIAGRELWRSDGTAAGTTLVKDIRSAPTSFSNPNTFTVVGNETYFWANLRELWKTDGTEAGTQLVKSELPTQNSWPSPLVNVNGAVYFYANDATAGRELFKTDGTSAGTVRVTDLMPGALDSFFLSMRAIGGYLYFGGPVGPTGATYGLWRTDGTAGGTTLVQDLGPSNVGLDNITAVGNSIYFTSGSNPSGTYSLWRTDGTPGTATKVKSFVTVSGAPTFFAPMNGILYFAAGDGSSIRKLWRTDGTTAGTTVVAANDDVEFLTPIGNVLYFTAGRDELWKTDGTAAGTVSLHAFQASSGITDNVLDLTPVGNALYFVALDAATGGELWRSDGTAAGTAIVKDLVQGSGSSNPSELTDVAGTLFFRAGSSASGVWRSDGTAAGTQFIANPTPQAGVFSADGLTAFGTDLIFSADDGLHGRELWKAYGLPPAPSGQASVGASDVTVTWTTGTSVRASLSAGNPSAQITGYGIERRTGTAGAWSQIAIAAGNMSSYVDHTAAHGTNYNYRIRAVGSGGETYSSVIAVAANPTVTAASFDYAANPQRVRATFDRDVSASLQPGDLSFRLAGSVDAPTTAVALTWDSATRTATFTLPPNVADGNYVATIAAGGVSDGTTTLAADYSLSFFILRGDVDRDRTVGPADFNVLSSNFGQTGKTWAQGDLDGDGTVGPADFNLLASRFGTTLQPPSQLTTVSAATSAPAAPSPTTTTTKAPVTRTPVAVRPAPSTVAAPHRKKSTAAALVGSDDDGR